MSRDDEIREQQRQSWDRFSGGWAKWDHLVLAMLQAFGDEMLSMLEVEEDGAYLDVASGTGEPGLTIAGLAPRGSVVLTDLAAGMLHVARKSADRRGLSNVEVREASADNLPFDDESFDGVSCRLGLMFFPDVGAAVSEMVRVLRPGGRIATAVWAEPAGNPALTVPMAAIAAEVEVPTQPPDAPGLFRFAGPGAVSDLFASAGLSSIREVDVHSELVVNSAEEAWDYMTDVAAPIVAALQSVDEAGRERVRSSVISELSQFDQDGRLSVPIHGRCITASK
jgi:ubiquinone/menaquinone biosynthesis C-methylase UbiE